MKINDDFFVEGDDTCFTLYRRVVVTGENTRGRKANPESIGMERNKVIGYYSTLSQALIKARDLMVGNAADLNQTLVKIEESTARIEKACTP